MHDPINLGDVVVDTVSGFRGVAVSKHIYLTGSPRISLQPVVNGEGKLPEIETFDECACRFEATRAI